MVGEELIGIIRKSTELGAELITLGNSGVGTAIEDDDNEEAAGVLSGVLSGVELSGNPLGREELDGM